jgi:hypothetical protein
MNVGDFDFAPSPQWQRAADFEAMLSVKHLTTAMTASGFERALSMKRLTMTVARLESCDEHAAHDQPIGCRADLQLALGPIDVRDKAAEGRTAVP